MATIKVKGFVDICLNGEYQGSQEENLVVDDGISQIAAAIANNSTSMPVAIALGDDGSDVSSSDSSLSSETTRSSAEVTENSSSVEFYNSFDPGEGTGYVRELGLFSDEDSGGTMFARIVPSEERYKGEDDTLEVTWTIQISAS